jgi:hypothetical protein
MNAEILELIGSKVTVYMKKDGIKVAGTLKFYSTTFALVGENLVCVKQIDSVFPCENT